MGRVKFFQISKYMSKKYLPIEVQSKFKRYLEYSLDPEKISIQEKELFKILSTSLKKDLITFVNGNVLKQIQVMQHFSSNFLESLVMDSNKILF